MITTSGAARYSRTVALEANAKAFFKVLSNPFREQLVLNMTLTSAETVVLNVYDSRGALIKKQTFSGNAGNHTFSIDQLSSLSRGVYLVEAISGKQRFAKQVVKD
ncbi:MAG: T9SS type A sorting domain-containing protein [Chitinophagaceae bacterium]|nr:T9SS type A sorting domain-containing protein [Chitinophagaceae bacterium]